MQRGRFTGTGRAADKKQTIRLADDFFQLFLVIRCKTHFFQRDRLTRRQNPHHHIFHAPSRWNGRHAQFNIQGRVFAKLDFAILRFAFFRNIHIAHDFDTGNKRIAITGRNFDIRHQ